MNENTNRFEHIDSLRAIAALSVLVFHIAAHLFRAPDTPEYISHILKVTLLDWIDMGRFGVVLFFLVSGFVIPFSLAGGGLKKFWISRFFRLYPPYWIGLLAVAVTEILFNGARYGTSQLLMNMTMMPQAAGVSSISGIYWTLSVELIFYISCAVLYARKLLGRRDVTAAIVLLLALMSTGPILANHVFGFHLPIQFMAFHLSFLFAGTLIRLCILDGGRRSYLLLAVVLITQLSMLPIVAGAFFSVDEGFTQFGSLSIVNAYLFATLLFVLAVRYKKPVNSFLLKIGAGSYSLYLLHWPICVVLIALLPGNTTFSIFLFVVLGVFLSIAVARLAHRWIELPAIDLGKSFARARAN